MVRPTKKRSIVWEFFDTCENDKVRCRKCNTELKFFKNTTNLHDHIKRKHDLQLKSLLGESPEKELPVQQENTATYDTTNIPSGSGNSSSTYVQSTPSAEVSRHTLSPPPKKRMKQLRLSSTSKCVFSEEEANKIDMRLVHMIALDFQPMSIVEDEGFRLYSNSLKPEYTLPSRKTLSEVLIPAEYNNIKVRLLKLLEETNYLSITTDLWSSGSNKSYITVTGHFIHEFKFHSVVLATEEIKTSHTGENISKAISTVLEKFNITDKVVTAVTDNGSNMKKAISDELKKHNHFCVAHTINLSVQDAIGMNVQFSSILTKCRALVTYFKKSNVAAYKLREVQQQMGLPVLALVQDVATRWNSELMMLERLLELKLPVTVALASLTNAERNLESEEWNAIQEVIAIFKPVLSVTEKLSGELYPTMSLVVPIIRGLQKSLQKKITNTSIAMQLKLSLIDVINRRLGNLESNRFVGKATFLDPRFKKSGFGNEENANNIHRLIVEELSGILAKERNLTAPPETAPTPIVPTSTEVTDEDEIWEEFDQKIASRTSTITPTTTATLIVKQYVEMSYIDRKEDPIEFWKKHHSTFKDLYKLVCKYLCIPATSVPAERIFSIAGLITNDRRNRLGSEKIDQIIFLNRNIKSFSTCDFLK
jgi:hypothetical protein